MTAFNRKIVIILLTVLMLCLISCKNTGPAESTANVGTVEETSGEPEKTDAGSSPLSTETASAAEDDADDKSCYLNSCLFGMTQEAFDAAFSALLDGLFTGKTEEIRTYKYVGADFGFHFPDVVYYNDSYLAYYICYNTPTGKGGVGLAVSGDAVEWTDKGCVIPPDADYDCNGAYFAGVWLDQDGTFYLVYECKGGEGTEYGTLENIALAKSKDGENWEKCGVILYKNTKLKWQTANIGTPDLYKVGDTWYMTFHGFNYTDCQIGLAYGTDLTDLTVVKKPVIPTKSGTRYSGTTGRRDIIFCGGYYYMVYEISTDQVPGSFYAGAKWTHMFARSKDMMTWEITDGPQLIQQTDDGEATGFGFDGPCWIASGGKLYVYMRNGPSTEIVELVAKG